MKAHRLILAAVVMAIFGMTIPVSAQNRPQGGERRMSDEERAMMRKRESEMKRMEEETRQKMEERYPGKNYDALMEDTFPDERGFRSRLMVMWQLAEYLDIDGATADTFFPVYMQYLKTRDELTGRMRWTTRHIIENADEQSVQVKDLQDDVESLKKIEDDLAAAREEFMKKSKGMLDDRQYIKLVVFEEKVKEDIFRRIRVAPFQP